MAGVSNRSSGNGLNDFYQPGFPPASATISATIAGDEADRVHLGFAPSVCLHPEQATMRQVPALLLSTLFGLMNGCFRFSVSIPVEPINEEPSNVAIFRSRVSISATSAHPRAEGRLAGDRTTGDSLLHALASVTGADLFTERTPHPHRRRGWCGEFSGQRHDRASFARQRSCARGWTTSAGSGSDTRF